MSKSFKNIEDSFSANSGEDIEEYFKIYERASIGCKLKVYNYNISITYVMVKQSVTTETTQLKR